MLQEDWASTVIFIQFFLRAGEREDEEKMKNKIE